MRTRMGDDEWALMKYVSIEDVETDGSRDESRIDSSAERRHLTELYKHRRICMCTSLPLNSLNTSSTC